MLELIEKYGNTVGEVRGVVPEFVFCC